MSFAEGCDLARYEEYFHPEIASAPIDFAFQKATQGYSYVDLAYDKIWEGLQYVGVRGAYHYQVAGLSWIAQADHFLETTARHDYHIYSLDVEEYGNAYTDAFFQDTKRIVEYWRKSVNKKILIYTNGSTYDQMYTSLCRSYGQTVATSWLEGVDLWIANPTTAGAPIMPKYRKSWTFHQYSWVGLPSRWGTGGKGVDENVFNGDIDALYKWAGLEQEAEKPQEGSQMSKWYRVTANALNIRSGPGASYMDVGDLLNNDVIEVLETVGGWHHIDYIYRNGQKLDTPAVAWCSGAYTKETTSPVTPPVEPPATADPDYIVAYWADGKTQKYIPE